MEMVTMKMPPKSNRRMTRHNLKVSYSTRVPRENRENGQMIIKFPVREKNWEFGNFAKNTGNLVCSSSEFPESKGNRYFDIGRENFQFWGAVLCM